MVKDIETHFAPHDMAKNLTYVSMSVCQTVFFESPDAGSSFSFIRYISWEYGSSMYMKVIGSRSRSQKHRKSLFLQRKNTIDDNSRSIKYRAYKVCV